MSLKNKKISLICQSFFSYHDQILNELLCQGAIANRYDERHSNSFLSKVMIRLKLNFLLSFFIDAYYSAIIKDMVSRGTETVLLVGPETIGRKHIQKLKNNNIKVILYLWDSLENKGGCLNYSDICDDVITFDDADVNKIPKSRFLPLFYDNSYKYSGYQDKKYDISFIGTVHSDRYEIVRKIKNQLPHKNLFFYLYVQSYIIYLTRRWFIKKYKDISRHEFKFEQMNTGKIQEIFYDSKIILDINHPDQRGLTSRTFETLAGGCKLITTNKNIKKYPFFNNNDILIIDRKKPKIEKSFVNNPLTGKMQDMIKPYSLKLWILNVFNCEKEK